jgi:hypothetical protein
VVPAQEEQTYLDTGGGPRVTSDSDPLAHKRQRVDLTSTG